ncbi:hypothetical protein [Carnimonas nigrificans]|uniref:hypothetical protein n=1 Tax=Carnimonas nigrificans TaxID=64323 RepID=UPI0004713E91|nr:hypothetical protein [Carnimonas nigrificans]
MSKHVFSSLAVAASLAIGCGVTQAQAAEHDHSDNPLVKECLAQGQAKDGGTFKTHSYVSDNLSRYEQNQPYRLTVSLQGRGNTFYNLSCQVDESGSVTYQSYAIGGMPLE